MDINYTDKLFKYRLSAITKNFISKFFRVFFLLSLIFFQYVMFVFLLLYLLLLYLLIYNIHQSKDTIISNIFWK